MDIPEPLRKRIADIAANATFAASGRKLVEDGVVSMPGFPDVKVDLLADWSANPFNNRSWQWSNASFNFVPGLIAYHSQGGGYRSLGFAIRALRAWNRAVNGRLRKYEFAHNDHATARQAENLLFLLAYMVERNLGKDARAEIESAIHGHADALMGEDFYSRHTNHGIEQSRVLAMIADFFPGHPDSKARLQMAVERLASELEAAFTKEGVHVENSPAYHSYVSLSFIKIVDYFPPAELGELAKRIDELMPRAMRFLTHIVRPDGCYPPIGDTQAVKVPNHFKRYSKSKEYAHLRNALTDGSVGVPPHETTAFYPGAGYFIVRDAWYRQGEGARAFHMVFRSGFRSRYHRHDDDLSLVLYCGEDWLVDSGAYSYSERDPVRRYMRSKWAHNVPVLSQPKAKRWDLHYPSMVLPMQRLPSIDRGEAVRAVSHAYPGHVAIRDLRVDPAVREFWVSDSLIQVEPLGRKRYLSLWHIPSDKDIRINDQTVEVISRVTGNRMLIDNMGRKAKSIVLLDPGVDGLEGPVMSRVSNKTEAVQLLAYEWPGQQLQSALRFRIVLGHEPGHE
jgi:hypothetical protein